MTGSRELTLLRELDYIKLGSDMTRQTHALQSIAVSLAAIADLYELEASCMALPDDEDAEDASEAHPS